jgi:hypothetical protein
MGMADFFNLPAIAVVVVVWFIVVVVSCWIKGITSQQNVFCVPNDLLIDDWLIVVDVGAIVL